MLAILGPSAINDKKFSAWKTRLQALGLVWDTQDRHVSIMPRDKLEKTLRRIHERLVYPSYTSKAAWFPAARKPVCMFDTRVPAAPVPCLGKSVHAQPNSAPRDRATRSPMGVNATASWLSQRSANQHCGKHAGTSSPSLHGRQRHWSVCSVPSSTRVHTNTLRQGREADDTTDRLWYVDLQYQRTRSTE